MLSLVSRWILCVGLVLLSDHLTPGGRAAEKKCESSVCEYTFNIRNDRTMLYRPKDTPGSAYKVGLNGTRLQIVESNYFRPSDDRLGEFVDDIDDVITADGVSRNILTINGKLPGPTIEVTEGAQIVVKVVNWLRTDGVTIHWHGIYHKGNMWMDGAAAITQCPISPYQSFTYRFKAEPAGTHWYHAHNGLQRIDGLSGMLVIHPEGVPPPPTHTLMVADWMHDEGITLEISNPYDGADGYNGAGEHLHSTVREYGPDGVETAGVVYISGLINGRGRYGGEQLPLSRFLVSSDSKYRFRTVNSGGEFPFTLSVDGHVMEVVALDGTEIRPYSVDAAVVAPGETLDFEIKASQAAMLYWLRARTLCDMWGDMALNKMCREVLSIIQYAGSSATADPTSSPRECTPTKPCKILNCPFENYPAAYNRQCVSLEEMRSVNYDFDGLMDGEVDTELFLNGGFNWGSSINGRKMLTPNAPLFMKKRRMADCDTLCIDQKKGCVCSGNYSIPVGKNIQLILSNLHYKEKLIAHHSMHLHGHSFAVLKIGYGTYKTSGHYLNHTQQVVCEHTVCQSPQWNTHANVTLNLENPPIKNTIVVPARGYVVVRFKSDNPGRWLFHCHTITHNMEGMSVLIMEGEEQLQPPVPKNFPTCYGFDWKDVDDGSNGNEVDMKNVEEMPKAGNKIGAGIGIGFVMGIVFTMILLGCSYHLYRRWQKRNKTAMDRTNVKIQCTSEHKPTYDNPAMENNDP